MQVGAMMCGLGESQCYLEGVYCEKSISYGYNTQRFWCCSVEFVIEFLSYTNANVSHVSGYPCLPFVISTRPGFPEVFGTMQCLCECAHQQMKNAWPEGCVYIRTATITPCRFNAYSPLQISTRFHSIIFCIYVCKSHYPIPTESVTAAFDIL